MSGDTAPSAGLGADHVRSSRTWVIGEGHLPLRQARERLLDRVEEWEAELLAAEEAQRAAWAALRKAQQEHQRASDDLAKKRDRHDALLQKALYVLGPKDDLATRNEARSAGPTGREGSS